MTDPTTRALKLLSLLGHRTVWSGPHLAEELGVTPRTLRRDVCRLRTLGYTVDAEPGQGGGYALRRGQALPPLLLDEEEALAVTLAVATASGSVVEPEAAGRALTKIEAVLPSGARARSRELRASTDVSSARVPPDARVLVACSEAIRRRRRVRFSYVDRHGVGTERWVEPHQLVCRGEAWYMAAYDVARDAWRFFRLDRMSQVQVGVLEFRRRADAEKALEDLRQPMPVEAYRHRVTLHVQCPVEDAPEFMRWQGSELRQINAGACEFTTGADDPQRAAQWLVGIPFDFTVVGDEAVQQAVAALAVRLRSAVQDS